MLFLIRDFPDKMGILDVSAPLLLRATTANRATTSETGEVKAT